MSRAPHPKVLLAEGKDEQYLLPEILEQAGIAWPKPVPVDIKEFDGISNLLEPDTIEVEYKESRRVALGLVVDANGDPVARWKRVCARLTLVEPGFPQEVDPAGIVYQAPERPRLGLWLMPDNIRSGMLESLLLAMRTGAEAVWAHATASVATARSLGAPLREAHVEKAELHTWLAWQDPPGQALGTAAKARKFDVDAAPMRPFVAWFRRLFEV